MTGRIARALAALLITVGLTAAGLTAVGLAAAGFTVVGIPVGAPAAHADPTGGIEVIPGEGSNLVAPRLRTSDGCPQSADAYYARMFGQGFPADGQVVTSNTTAGISHSTGFDVYFGMIFKDFADLNGATLGGPYDISVYCIDSFSQEVFAEFSGSLQFNTPTTYSALGTAKPDGPPPPPLSVSGSGEGVDLNAPPSGTPGPPTEQPDGAAAAASPGGDGSDSGDSGAGNPEASEPTAATTAQSSDSGDNMILTILVTILVVIALIWAVAYGIVRRRRSS